MTIELINPDGLYEPPTYSHLAIARGSHIVFVAGQVGFDADGNLVGDDHASQAQQAYRNVATAVEAAGGSIEDVARITVYVVGHRPELIEPLRAARDAVFGEHRPASTFLGVETLIRPELFVEVEAIAVLE